MNSISAVSMAGTRPGPPPPRNCSSVGAAGARRNQPNILSTLGSDWANLPDAGDGDKSEKALCFSPSQIAELMPLQGDAPPLPRRLPSATRGARSQVVAALPIGACRRRQHDSATAKEYCPSSSAAARHSQFYARARRRNIRLAVGALSLASVVRRSTRRGIGPYATVPSRCDASPSIDTLSR